MCSHSVWLKTSEFYIRLLHISPTPGEWEFFPREFLLPFVLLLKILSLRVVRSLPPILLCFVASKKNQESCVSFHLLQHHKQLSQWSSFITWQSSKGPELFINSVALSYREPDVKVMHNMYLYIFMNLNQGPEIFLCHICVI